MIIAIQKHWITTEEVEFPDEMNGEQLKAWFKENAHEVANPAKLHDLIWDRTEMLDEDYDKIDGIEPIEAP